ncbi:MAG: hypothetical protein GC192_09530 [Bacteroidetes bacterium]|nr:hypothetical protein [Bacteroidota bacterium]
MRQLILLVIVFFVINANGQTYLQGIVKDIDSGEPIVFCEVQLLKGNNIILCTESDIEGFYSFNDIDAGDYRVHFESIGFNHAEYHRVRITTNEVYWHDVGLTAGTGLECIQIYLSPYPPIYAPHNISSMKSLSPKEMMHMSVQ